jgi:(p)ppGpp synthase/HD superfamily hydrolase
MSVLSPPRHELVNKALTTTREMCKGDIIDGSTVLRHAVGVVVTLEEFVSDIEPTLAAGILMHDTPYSVEDQTALDAHILNNFGEETYRIVRTIEREHASMGKEHGPGYNRALKLHIGRLVLDRPVLLATAADKITSFRSIVRRAPSAPDPQEFWSKRGAFIELMPYFQAFQSETASYLPQAMAAELGQLVGQAMTHTQTHTN